MKTEEKAIFNAPLTMAAKHNHTSTFDHLLQLGADPNLRDGRGLTAKEIALRDGSAQMLRLLNFVGGNVTAVTRAGGNPLTGPASDGYLEVLEYLLKEGTNPNDHVGQSPLFVATRERQHKAIKLLARYQAVVDAPGDYSDIDHYYRPVPGGGEVLNFYQQANPLMLAITQVDLASVTTLIAVGADVNATCRKLHYRSDKAIAREKGGDISQAELEANYELIFNLPNWTPLMEAVETNNTKMVKTLLEAGADADRVLTGGYSARSLAKEIGNLGIIELLD